LTFSDSGLYEKLIQHLLAKVEIKYGRPEEKSILKFLENFKIKKGLIVTRDEYRQRRNLSYIPLWRLLLEGI